METQNLKFIETLTVSEFKAKNNNDSIKIVQNPHTAKLFFTCGGVSGAVSSNGYKERPVISKVSNGKDEFYVLHNEAHSNVVDEL
jgi:hypothetical protein